MAPQTDWTGLGPTDHFVQFYDAHESLVDAVASFIAAATRSGDVGVVIAARAHINHVEARLRAAGVDLSDARERG